MTSSTSSPSLSAAIIADAAGSDDISVALPPVVVVGSINRDYILRIDRRPRPGETIGNAVLELSDGGKGANQAAAAAAASASVALVANVGDDEAGTALPRGLVRDGVLATWVTVSPAAPSGTAFITVTPDGENEIVVAPGANALLSPDHVRRAIDVIEHALVVIIQLEIEGQVVRAAVEAAGPNTTVVLNASPISGPLDHELLQRVDVLLVNQHGSATLLGGESLEPSVAARALLLLGCGVAVITLGSSGVVVAVGDETWFEAAPPARVVDTTGAGDVFAGVLAAGLALGDGRAPTVETLKSALKDAVSAASQAVALRGARVSQIEPRRREGAV